MRKGALTFALLIAALAIAGAWTSAPAAAQAKYPPGFCDYASGVDGPVQCSFEAYCMPPTAGKCQKERDWRWRNKCLALLSSIPGSGSGTWGPQPGWDPYCRLEAKVRNFSVPPPRATPSPTPTPTPTPTPPAPPKQPPGYCDVAGYGPAPSGWCTFDRNCMVAAPDKPCRDERDKRWRDRCRVVKPPALPAPEPGWEAYCQREQTMRETQPADPAPPAPPPPGTPASEQPAGPVAALEGTSPLCARVQTETCRRSKGASLSRPYPIENYAIEDHAESDMFDSDSWFPAMLQWLNQQLWYGLLQIITGALRLIEWAFSLRLVGAESDNALITSPELGDTLLHIHTALGESWMLFGILIAAAWGMWNGLVRMRTIQTLGGLLATLALMVATLVVMTAPDKTIGELSRVVNDSSLAGFAIASSGTFKNPAEAHASAQEELFNSLVLQPWCALQFGEPQKCSDDSQDWDDEGDDKETLADGYLAWKPGSEERINAWETLDGTSDKNEWTELQEIEGASDRFALLLLVAIGLVGAICLLLYLGVRLIMAAIEVLVLVLFAPVLLIAPAFGEAGRAAFLWYVRRLLERIMAKWVYAIFLGVVVLASTLIAQLGRPGTTATSVVPTGFLDFASGGPVSVVPGMVFYDRWWLLVAFWWGTFIKRDEILALLFLDVGSARGGGSSGGVFGALMAYRGARQLAGDVGRVARGAAGAAAAGPLAIGGVVHRRHNRHQEATGRVQAAQARGQLREQFANAHKHRQGQAHDALNERSKARNQLADVERKRAANERNRSAAQRALQAERDKPKSVPNAYPHDPRQRDPKKLARLNQEMRRYGHEEAKLAPQAEHLRDKLDDPRYAAAERFLSEHGDGPLMMGEREFTAAVDQRRGELQGGKASDDANLISAGLDPSTYHQHVAAGRTADADAMKRQSQAAMDRDSALIGSLYDANGDRYGELPGVSGWTTRDADVAARGRDGGNYGDARRQIKEEARTRRQRDGMFRR